MIRSRIDHDEIHGVWPPLLLPWDEQWQLDQHACDANLERLVSMQPHGLYTLDSASEFYTLEWEDWLAIAQRFVWRARRQDPKLKLGLGATWTNQSGAIRRIQAARDLGVEVIHLSAPYWLPLDEDGLVRFYAEVNRHAGHLGVVIYAPPHGKIRLTGPLYERLVSEAPCIIGSKTTGDEISLVRCSPEGARQSHFVHEQHLALRARDGARGCYSALAGVSLELMKRWWGHIEHQRWEMVDAYDKLVQRFYANAIVPLRERGVISGAIDKAMAQAGGAPGSRLIRQPYASMPDELYARLQQCARELLADEAPLRQSEPTGKA